MPSTIQSPARRTLVLLAGLLSVGACATKQDVRDLRTDVLEQLREIAATQDSLRDELVRQAVLTQDTLRSTSRELVDIRGDVLTTLNRLDAKLNKIEEMVGQNSLNITSLRDRMEGSRGGTGGTTGGMGVPSGVQPAAGSGEAEAMYAAAIRQFNRGSLSAARAAFQQFLTAYPSNELAPGAHYYLADILVQEERLEEAVDAFTEIAELFPTSERVPESLYRIGALQAELGRTDEARAVLERLVNTYPEHPAASLARDLLADIGEVQP